MPMHMVINPMIRLRISGGALAIISADCMAANPATPKPPIHKSAIDSATMDDMENSHMQPR